MTTNYPEYQTKVGTASGADTFFVKDGGKIDIESGGTLVVDGSTFSTIELKALEGVTAGTLSAGKALIVDSNKRINELDVTALKINTISATTVNQLADQASSADSTIVLGAGGAATQTITIQLKDAEAVNLTAVNKISCYFCTDVDGAVPSTSGAATSVTATTGAILKAVTAKLDLDLLTDATGKAVLVVNNTGGGGAYTDRLAVVFPSGKVIVTAALNVTAA